MNEHGLRIRVFSATATAVTALAAFDRTLQRGGAQNVNLIPLSSVIPAGAEVVRAGAEPDEFTVGDRLYCVMAKEICSEFGYEAWAGLAWAVDRSDRGGVFVEAHGHSRKTVETELEASIATLIEDRPYWEFGPVETEIAGLQCEEHPVCALVIALFDAEPWSTADSV